MAINTLDQLIAAASQRVALNKTVSRVSVAGIPFSVFDLAGVPGAGVLAGTNTTAGVVPTDTTVGTPDINNFGAGNSGYIAKIEFSNTVASRIRLYDLLWKGGAYAFNANVSLGAQPSYSSRVLNGTDFTNTELWLEAVTAFTGNQTIQIGYTNQAGTGGRNTGAIATGIAPTVGRMVQLPLQAGDTGLQRVDSVLSSVSTAGTFNVLVMRRLWEGRVRIANDGDVHDMLKTGLVQMFQDSAFFMQVIPDSTATGLPECQIEVVNG